MKAIILIRTDHIEQHPLWMQEIATPNPLAVDGIVGCYPMEESERTNQKDQRCYTHDFVTSWVSSFLS